MKILQFDIKDFNPDCMSADELDQWSEFIGNGRRPAIAKQWFPGIKGQFKLARYVKHYCVNKSVAIALRLKGEIQTASNYEHICDRIYKEDLQPHVNW